MTSLPWQNNFPEKPSTRMSSRRLKQVRSAKSISAGLSMRDGRDIETLRQNEVVYKSKIRSLEVELETLKCRLDSLRKAKNTTIVRREREQVVLSSPKLGRRRSALSSPIHSRPSTALLQETTPTRTSYNHDDTLKQLEDLRSKVGSLDAELASERASHEQYCQELVARHAQEMNTLRVKSQAELKELREQVEELKQQRTKEPVECDKCEDVLAQCDRVKKENQQVTEKIQQMLEINQRLRDSNILLQGRCEALLEDLSVKEAKWTEREEALKAEIRKQWGQRYHEWMVKAEKKMEELQQVNVLLQGMLRTKAHNPDL